MAQVLSTPKGHTKYLSHDIQNQIISCVSSQIKTELIEKIHKAQHFSVIIDTTQDLSKKDQMSFVVRYVDLSQAVDQISEGEGVFERKKVKIKESFVRFFHVKDPTAAGLSAEIVTSLEGWGLDMKKCRGQGYDGAAVMKGAYSGVQKRLKDIEELAVYVHCSAHNLNLVINDAVGSVTDVANYFAILQSLYVFFGQSINRWDVLLSLTGESDVTLKKLNPTRWASRHESILAIKLRYPDVMKALREISLKNKKKEEISEAKRLTKLLDSYQFVFLTVLLSKVFTHTNVASKCLQGTEMDLERATAVLQSVDCKLKKLRASYLEVKEEAAGVAAKWNVDAMFPVSRQPKIKRHFDELAEDYRFCDSEHKFKVNVFFPLLDLSLIHI